MSWTLDIKEMSWVERTEEETDFLIEALHLRGDERILDLACGFGRHSLALARRGYPVIGVDITADYIADARQTAGQEQLDVEFIQADVLELSFSAEFDVVLNMADGAIGYFATEEENLRLFDVIGNALKEDGKHMMAVCSAAHAAAHCPKRHWQAGSRSLSLADFLWNAETSRMIYRGQLLKFGEILEPFADQFPEDTTDGLRLYTIEELAEILAHRDLKIEAAYGDYDTSIPASPDQFMQIVCSRKGPGER